MTNTLEYGAFLQSKRAIAPTSGIDVPLDAIHPMLFPFQQDLVKWALHKGRAALFEDCGLGKTLQQIEFARLTGQRALILAPLAVAHQTVSEGKKIDVEVHYTRSGNNLTDGINITNYEMLEHFDPSKFGTVVLDECFAPETPIDTPQGAIPIKDILPGDFIYNAAGIDRVSDVHRREVQYAVRVTINGKSIISSPNHPYFTQRGWIGAQDLIPGDRLMETAQAVRMVWNANFPKVPQYEQSTLLRFVLCGNMARESARSTGTSGRGSQASKATENMRVVQSNLRGGERANPQAFLRDILLSEMANESTRTSCESSQSSSSRKARQEEECMVSIGQSQSKSRDRTHSLIKSNEQPEGKREGLPPVERNAAQTFRAWGQWNGIDISTTDTTGCSWERLDSGTCFITGTTNSRLSHALQDRYRQSQAQNRYRSGWALTSQSQSTRSEERCKVSFARVDSLEILELGHPDLERLRDADGHVYLYDIGATQHPSFSVNGFLVHNSSLLKSYMGKTKRTLVEAFAHTPYRLCCTATPAPNDVMEIGNHAEFLGIMPSSEMLMRWFINDTMQNGHYRLKGHAEKDFWEWVASWAISLRKPSDLGYPDQGFALPELKIKRCYVETDITVGVEAGQLFRAPAMSATNIHKELRLTVVDRAQAVADLVNNSSDIWIAWCNTNYEADELKRRIPDAIEVRGSESIAEKERKLTAFTEGKERVIISKPQLAGFGLNWQHCHKAAFVGLSYSFEQFYQAVRRIYRFGQQHPVEVVIVAAETESTLVTTLERKTHAHLQMSDAMNASASRLALQENLTLTKYNPQIPMILPTWLHTENERGAA